MKLPFPYIRVAAALGLASAMMIGCQEFLGSDKAADGTVPAAEETGTLSLSIRNDSACLGQWHAILAARSAGHADSASEAAFFAKCVIEGKPEKDGPRPPVPPPPLSDSGLRCRWIVSQIEGGRDSLTVSYRKYCPEDCRKLEVSDSASHEKLCREPKPHPVTPPPISHDTVVPPPKPPMDDTCAILHARLEEVKPGQAGRADLEHAYATRCKEPVPHDTVIAPPPPKPPSHDSVCADLKLRLGASVPGTPARSELEAAYKSECTQPLPPTPPALNCDSLRVRLADLNPASADYARLAGQIKEHCPAK